MAYYICVIYVPGGSREDTYYDHGLLSRKCVADDKTSNELIRLKSRSDDNANRKTKNVRLEFEPGAQHTFHVYLVGGIGDINPPPPLNCILN